MALGKKKEERSYFSISYGKVVKGSGNTREYFSFIEGCIKSIYTRHSNFGGEDVLRWCIDMVDGEEIYSLCLPYGSGVFKSIILAIASKENLTKQTYIRIKPYEGANGFTKVVVYADGEKLDWITRQLPPQETITIGEKKVKDDTKQMEFISSLCETIRERLKTEVER